MWQQWITFLSTVPRRFPPPPKNPSIANKYLHILLFTKQQQQTCYISHHALRKELEIRQICVHFCVFPVFARLSITRHTSAATSVVTADECSSTGNRRTISCFIHIQYAWGGDECPLGIYVSTLWHIRRHYWFHSSHLFIAWNVINSAIFLLLFRLLVLWFLKCCIKH